MLKLEEKDKIINNWPGILYYKNLECMDYKIFFDEMDAKYIKRYKTKYFIESLIKEKEKLDKEGKYYDIDDLIVNIKEKEKKDMLV